MSLSPFLPLIGQHVSLRAAVQRLNARPTSGGEPKSALRISCISPARAYVIAALASATARPLVVILARSDGARAFTDELAMWLGDSHAVRLLPDHDALPYDYSALEPDTLADRLGVLSGLLDAGRAAQGRARLVLVASARAAMDLLLSPQELAERRTLLTRGQKLSPTELVGGLLGLGYEPAPVVDRPGTFSRRGGIVDVFAMGLAPVRLEFWGDEVESLRRFDASSQRSTEQIESALIGPAHELLPRPVTARLDLADTRLHARSIFERDSRLLGDGAAFSTMDFYRGWLGTATLFDFLPAGAAVVLNDATRVVRTAQEWEGEAETLRTQLEERGELPHGLPRPYRSWSKAARSLARPDLETLEIDFDPDAESLPFVHASKLGGRLDLLATKTSATDSDRTILVTQQSARLNELLQEKAVTPATIADLAKRKAGWAVVHGLLSEGWTSPDLHLELLTDSELFGWSKQRRSASLRRASPATHAALNRDQFIAELKEGELVVHVEHGIARYGGLVRTGIGSQPGERAVSAKIPGYAEYLLLEYAAGDRLYVPVAQADRVTHYVGSGEANPTLTRLGSGEWVRLKARVRRSVRDIAHELMELYAARDAVQGHRFPPDTLWQGELEGSFPFEETPDQVEAIGAVKTDMARARPMDRLLVGDVGFGKTEVALRAAFKAVQDGRQVAVLVPTTVLAQQHDVTFRQRLAPFPVRIEMLSRFRSASEQRAVVKDLQDGSVDICIGTHRLVQRDVKFKSLGLVIIDEEQRFGVAHKERLKQLRHEVDVLTLTATPIPRTLHMGLSGVRDMSLLETPPEARMPVRTYVSEYDEAAVGEAILRELERGGQVYFVHNRVKSIAAAAERVRRLLPEARIGIGHGQMAEDDLERTMLAFAEGEIDILVCTTIIESGLDIPNANTLIVEDAHRFGLAQLYQLRGRVGRSTARAYAYFLYGQDAYLSEVARERLQAIFEATELGAGMRIAMKDLEIRGAGNLLGAAQSGHIAAVGFDLYTQLLAEQVDLLKAHRDGREPAPARPDPSLDLPVGAFIPPEYVSDDAVRLRLYQRFAGVQSDDDLKTLTAEMEDRFGVLHEPAQLLIYLSSLRLRAVEAGVQGVSLTDDEVIVKLEPPRLSIVAAWERQTGRALKRASNQVRFPRGAGTSWMGPLYSLLELVVGAETQAINHNGEGDGRHSPEPARLAGAGSSRGAARTP